MTREELYDKCENMEELYDNFYYPLLVENQELKSQLKGTTHCFDEEEHEKLKKQLEDIIISYTEEHNLRHNSDLKLDVLKTQQKEFIEWLKEELKRINPSELTVSELVDSELDQVEFTQYLTYKSILQKYKEIIGDDK